MADIFKRSTIGKTLPIAAGTLLIFFAHVIIKPEFITQVADQGVLLGVILNNIQAQFPIASVVATAILIVLTGVTISVMARYANLYRKNSYTPIILFTILCCGTYQESQLLVLASCVTMLSSYCYFCIKYIYSATRFSHLFVAHLCIATTPLIYPPLALLLLLPIFRAVTSTWREGVVIITALLFPTFVVSYANWAVGSNFLETVQILINTLSHPTTNPIFDPNNIALIITTIVVLTLLVGSISLIISDVIKLNGNNKHIIYTNIYLIILSVGSLFLPSATSLSYGVASIPITIITSVLLIRSRKRVATAIFLTLFCVSIAQSLWFLLTQIN